MGVLVFETLLSLKKHEPKQCAGTRSCFKKVSYSATLITKKRYRVNGTGERGPGGQSFGQVWRVLGQVVLPLSMRTPAVFTFRHTGFQLALTRFTSNAPIQLCSRVWVGSGISGGAFGGQDFGCGRQQQHPEDGGSGPERSGHRRDCRWQWRGRGTEDCRSAAGSGIG